MSDVAIRAHGLGKQYDLRQAAPTALLRDTIGGWLTPWKRRRSPSQTMIWSLRDVSFDVPRGEAVAIVGRNGAGKSTLLKVLSRITAPTEGYADVYGRVGSLLEVGTGFHPDLTGRENTFLNGAILGMRKAEVARQFDEIVAFAEIDRFIDTPVRFYSSGMYMRLAFAVAAHLRTEILLVDEVLAVGDAHFQKKCLGKMDDVARHGRTVLFVSHNLEAVQRLCANGLLLERGRLSLQGRIGEVVTRYRGSDATDDGLGLFRNDTRRGSGWARVEDVRLVSPSGARIGAQPADADLVMEVDVALRDQDGSLRGLIIELGFASAAGQPLFSLMNVDDGVLLPSARSCTLRFRVEGPVFVPGRYRVNAYLGDPQVEHVDELADALEFEIQPPLNPWRPYEMHAYQGSVCRRANWRVVSADREPARAAAGTS